jgi:drug/metabolite transporter (DMT)-like permease
MIPMRRRFSSYSSTSRGILMMLLAILIFTSMDALAKGMVAAYPAPQVVWARFTGQLLLVMVILGPRLLQAARTRYPGTHVWRSVTQLGATTFFFLSLNHIGLAEATALTDINPVLITLGAALFLGERLTQSRLIGVALAMVGALIVIRPGTAVFSTAALLPLGAAVCYSVSALLTRHVGARESHWASMIWAAAFGTIATSLVLPFVWQPIATGDLWRFGLIGVLGAGAQLCLIRAFSLAEASVVAPFTYTGILFATGWGIGLYDEYPDSWTLIGAVVIVAAGLYVWRSETARARTLA